MKQQIVTGAARFVAGGTNRRTSITVHETGNRSRGADAQAHANLQSGGNSRAASWHVQVDDKQAIRSYEDTARCWHAGRAALDSLSVEICVNSDGDYDKAVANAAEVVRNWRQQYDLPRSAVYQHAHMMHKNCPERLRSSGGWDEFVASTDPGSSSNPSSSSGSSSGSGKTVQQLAREVIDGKHGTGNARRRSLGSRYAAVQAEVNRQLSGSSSSSGSSAPARKSTTQLAREVIDGKHGNGEARRRSLGSRYGAVQREVNRMLS